MPTLAGTVERIVFSNPETGYVIARFHLANPPSAREALTTVVGTMPAIQPGEVLRLTGEWQTHPIHGRNFRVDLFEAEVPDSPDGIERFLGSGVIRGIGPVTAGRIVERFGRETIEIIDSSPDKLLDVQGISRKRLDVIEQSWRDRKKVRDLMMFLQAHGISPGLSARVYERYGDRAIDIIRNDPFQLAHEVHGIGFRTADTLASHLGFPKTSPSRYVAGLKYVLSEATGEGHVFLTRGDLLAHAAKLLGAAPPDLEPALLELISRGDALVEDDDVFLTPFFRAESGIARLLDRLRQTPSGLTLARGFDAEDVIGQAADAEGIVLAPSQRSGAIQALREKVSILTGGPGTGKTSTLRTIITALEATDVTFSLCAPTGRAAKRVSEATGRPASTIHRLLEYQPRLDVFAFDLANPLPVDFVVVDETSMLDTLLFYHLLKAVPPEAHLLLVGDADQLPAVGPGNVLRDLLASETIPVVTLTELFRQAQNSDIIVAAHEINEGRVPAVTNREDSDLFFIRGDDPPRLLDALRRLLVERIPARFGLDPLDDVQVISPMHAGPLGVAALNEFLQDVLNPSGGPALRRGDRVFRLNDKVMQTRNNYEKDVFNGDIGRVIDVDPTGALRVAYPIAGGIVEVEYESSDVEEIAHAYALSVHKAQGSEFPAVVMPLVTRHYMLLQRNLLYTAITRARSLCVLLGSEKALGIAVATDRGERRNTKLAGRLRRPEEGIQLDLL